MILAPLGDSALVLTWGDHVDDEVLVTVRAVADALEAAAIPGVVDVVPAFNTVTVFFDVVRAQSSARIVTRIRDVVQTMPAAKNRGQDRLLEIPLCYEGEYAPDLPAVAKRAGWSPAEVIARHAAADYRVHAIGFVPGFAYLGGLPAGLHTPRRGNPRTLVPAGSVGIGGAQTGIYPLETPGGWNLIGRTPLTLFDAVSEPPSLLRPGDRVRFKPISSEEFAAWK